MPASTMESRAIPNEGGGNEYGLTNVSSQGRVSITVVPPRRHASRSRSRTPFDHNRSAVLSNQVDSSSAYSGSSTLESSQSQPAAGRLSLKELYYRQKLEKEGHEQHELDEILRELLGDTQDSSAHNAHRRNASSTRASESSSSYKGSSSESAWLEQQQRKLSQRQHSRDVDDISQLHRQQKQLVSELKHVQTRRKESLGDPDLNANTMFSIHTSNGGVYRTETEVPVTSQEPEAYTVFIKPEEMKKVEEEQKLNVTQRSLTNVSHTHHNHYNFHDSSDEVFENDMRHIMEDQKRRIMQLEDELRKVKMGIEQQPTRPQRLEIDDEEDEEFSFKPVGIASLESGTGMPVAIQSSPIQPTGSSPHTPTHPTVAAASTPNSFSYERSGHAEGHSQTLPSQIGYSHTLPSQSGHSIASSGAPQSKEGVLSTFGTVALQPVNVSPMAMSPRTPYQFISPVSPVTDHVASNTTGRQRRMVMEEHHHQQHIYQPAPGSQTATLPSQASTMNQMVRQQSASYGFPNTASSPTSAGTGVGSNNNALHISTNGSQANSGGVNYATIASTSSQSGRLQQHNNNSGSHDQSHLSAKFVKDTSKYWYKPHISRDEVVSLLKNASPGTFIVRDSNSFPGAFGLAVKVNHLPANVQVKPGSDPAAEYVRFYLIEPTPKGVKLKGCANEPVFASLASLIYQHTLTPLALPCNLLLPDPDQYQFKSQSSVSRVDEIDGPALDNADTLNGSETFSSAADLLQRGAACNVVYMNNVDTETLTGPQAISRAVHHTFSKDILDTTVATFKVSADGITITDNNRKIFFRQHFPKDSISYCGIDSADRRFTQTLENAAIQEAKIFGFVAKRKGGNQCLLFAELDPDQPASAIVNFVSKVLLGRK